MEIYIIKASEVKNIDEALLKQFQKKEISAKNKWKTHCFTYLMLDRILKEVYKIENRSIIFDNDKPKLQNNTLHFSVSHSKDFIALGFSKSNCGLDIEKINPNRNCKSIAENLGFNTKTTKEFYQAWTEYEAEYKLGVNIGVNIGVKAKEVWEFENYCLTAVSENPQEKFELYFQSVK